MALYVFNQTVVAGATVKPEATINEGIVTRIEVSFETAAAVGKLQVRLLERDLPVAPGNGSPAHYISNATPDCRMPVYHQLLSPGLLACEMINTDSASRVIEVRIYAENENVNKILAFLAQRFEKLMDAFPGLIGDKKQ